MKRNELNENKPGNQKCEKENEALRKSTEKSTKKLALQILDDNKIKRSSKRKLDMTADTLVEASCSNKSTSKSSQIKLGHYESFDNVYANKKCAKIMKQCSLSDQNLWKSCEECVKWYCGDCSKNFLNSLDICKYC